MDMRGYSRANSPPLGESALSRSNRTACDLRQRGVLMCASPLHQKYKTAPHNTLWIAPCCAATWLM